MASARRRGNGEGNCYQRPDGRFEARVRLPDGRRKSYYGKTRTEAMRRMREALREYEAGKDLSAKRLTVAQFLDQWLDEVIRPNRAPKTIAQYEDLSRKHLVPSLGSKKLDALTTADVARMLREKRESGLAPKTCNHIRATLRAALNVAVKWGLITRNPVIGTEPIRGESRPIEPLSKTEVAGLLRTIEGHRHEALYRVTLSLGLRIGESLGLKWENVDLDGHEAWSMGRPALRVEWTLQRARQGAGPSELILKRPKTQKSRRVLPIPAPLVSVLRQHKARQAAIRLEHADVWDDQGLVFTTNVGTPVEPRNALREFHTACEQAGIPRRRLHDLRHTAVTMLIAQGVPLRVISELLGHSQLSTTADTYGHVLNETLAGATDQLAAILESSTA